MSSPRRARGVGARASEGATGGRSDAAANIPHTATRASDARGGDGATRARDATRAIRARVRGAGAGDDARGARVDARTRRERVSVPEHSRPAVRVRAARARGSAADGDGATSARTGDKTRRRARLGADEAEARVPGRDVRGEGERLAGDDEKRGSKRVRKVLHTARARAVHGG